MSRLDPGLSSLLCLFAQRPDRLLLRIHLCPVPKALDCYELPLKVGVPVLGILSLAVDRSKCLQPIAGEQSSKVVLALDVGKMESARRDGGSKVVVPVIVI